MSTTSLYFLSRDLTGKIFQSYFDRLDNTYMGFTRSIGYSIRLFNSHTSCICFKEQITNVKEKVLDRLISKKKFLVLCTKIWY